MKRLPCLLLMVLFLAACSSIDCPVQNVVSTQYALYGSDGAALTIGDTLTVTTTRNDGRDTTLLNKGIGISSFSLPVSYSHPEDVLVFHYDNETRSLHAVDTVWVKKDDIPHFESVDCNASFFHEITSVRHTGNLIDSIQINNPSVTYDSETVHFNVYLKTSAD